MIEKENYRLYNVFKAPSGLKFSLNNTLYLKLLDNEDAYFKFLEDLTAGEYFSQLMQFIFTFFVLLNGYHNFLSILIVNIIIGIIFSKIWNYLPLYKIKALSISICFLGNYLLKYMIHIVIIGIYAFIYFKNWKILLFYIIANLIGTGITSFLNGYRKTLNHNIEIANYALSKFKKNEEISDENIKLNEEISDEDIELIEIIKEFYSLVDRYSTIEKKARVITHPDYYNDIWNNYKDLIEKDKKFIEKIYLYSKSQNYLKVCLHKANDSFLKLLWNELHLIERLRDKANAREPEFTEKEHDMLSNEIKKILDDFTFNFKELKKEYDKL